MRDITDSKTFWRKVKPLFTKKVNLQTKITLVEKGKTLSEAEISSEVEKVISDDKEVAGWPRGLEKLGKWWFWENRLENKYIFWCGRVEKLEFLKCSIKILILFFLEFHHWVRFIILIIIITYYLLYCYYRFYFTFISLSVVQHSVFSFFSVLKYNYVEKNE